MKISGKRGAVFSRPCFGILLYLGVAVITALSPVSSTFGQCIDEPPGDLNYDCTVDMVDFSIIAMNWLADYSSDPNYYPTNVIFVSESDPCAGDLSGCGRDINSPCESIGKGIEEAVANGRTEVYVADGFYKETITLVNWISIRGGYDPCTWASRLDTTNTIIMGDSLSLHKKTIIADDINSPTVVEGFVIYGENNYRPGANSYVVWVKDSPGLSILSNWIVAGDGADGETGTNGTDGLNGVSGNPGQDAKDTSYDCYEDCNGTGENPGGAGGQHGCGGLNVRGGNGATAPCPDWDESANWCTTCSSEDQAAGNLPNGQDGPNGGGAGGTGGYDAFLDYFCTNTLFGSSDCYCHLPSSGPTTAGNGGDGSDGSNGGGGSGGSNPAGIVVSNEWIGHFGSNGSDATHGRGGGGGGAGGGVETYYNVSCSSDGASDVGGSGGGGGSGGCGGTGGHGGCAGGGSFGIFIVFTTTPVDVPAIEDNDIILGNGGGGGSGGNGGVRGAGGSGSNGGAGGTPGSDCWCAEAGGAGGAGGDGGHGGGGGGSCGGVAYGIYASGQGATPLNYCEISANNEFFGGAAGQGGSGGLSFGSSGGDGLAGYLGNCNF